MDNVISFLVLGLGFLGIFSLLHVGRVQKLIHSRRWYWGVMTLIFVLQLVSIGLIRHEVGDVKQFGKVGYFFRYGSDFYTIDQDHSQYPFFPFLIFFHGFANALSVQFKLFPFVAYLKCLLVIALHLIGYWINRRGNRLNQLLFLSSPITYASVIYHGQIDALVLLFFIAALVVFERWKSRWWGIALSGVLFAASVATKTWSILLAPLMLKFYGIKRSMVIGLVTVSFLAIDIGIYTQLVFAAKVGNILLAVTKPGGPVGVWGIGLLVPHNLILFGTLFLLGIGLIWRQKIDLWKSCLLLILWFYLVTPNWGVQYLFWVLPFLMMSKLKVFRTVYMWFGGMYSWLCYVNVAAEKVLVPLWIVNGMGLVTWMIILVWWGRWVFLSSRVDLG